MKGSTKKRAVADIFLERCAPVIALLEECSDPSCVKMLQAVAPDCLRIVKASRHAYQTQVSEMLEKEIAGIETSHAEAASEASAKIAEHNAAEGERVAAVSASEAALEAKRAERDVKDAGLVEAIAAVKNAKAALAHEQTEQEGLVDSHRQRIAEKDDLQQVLENDWKPVKEASFAWNLWRKRNHSIEQVVTMMRSIDADETLVAAVTPAMKEKLAERGPFTKKVIEQAESAMMGHAAQLDVRIGNIDTEGAERAAAVRAAEVALEAAEAHETVRQEALDNCEGEVGEQQRNHKNAVKAVEQAVPKLKRLTKAHQHEEQECERIRALVSQFKALNDRSEDEHEEEAEPGAPIESIAQVGENDE